MMRPARTRRGYRHGTRLLPVMAGLAAVLAVVGLATARAAPPPSGTDFAADHQQAAGSLADINAAIAAIIGAEDASTTGPAPYKTAARQAIDALVGAKDPAFDAGVSNPGDPDGAIGHVNRLLDRASTPPWVPALHGVLTNAQAAVAQLQDANDADDLDGYQLAASQALSDLEMARGRTTDSDALGGLSGAMANTTLAVTDAGAVENGCALPDRAGFGVYQGYLAYRAVALKAASGQGIDNPGGTTVSQHGDMLLFYTAAAPMVRKLCAASHAEATAAEPATLVRDATFRTGPMTARRSPLLIEAAATSGPPPALYTQEQAKAGAGVYAQSCASCHGATLQGTAAPALAGQDFLQSSAKNGWTVSVIRTIATQNMPLNDPDSLTPTQYAQVMAFLLASNCYPAGKTPFPEQDSPDLGKIVFGPLAQPAGTPDAKGVCQVH